MSALAHTSPDTAIARAERRLWLLRVMTGFCMALLQMLNPGGAADALPILVQAKAFNALSRAVRLCLRLEAETERLLRDLRAGFVPAPKAERPQRPETEDLEDREDLEDWESFEERESFGSESDKAFRAKLETLEAFLNEGAYADLTARERAEHLCRALGLNPAWSRWLGDDWLEDNLDLSDMPQLSASVEESPSEAAEASRRRAPSAALLTSVSRVALLPPPLHGFPPPRHALE